MTRRSLLPFLAATAALLTLVAPTVAKEGFEARLDAPLSIDSEPGSTLRVGWTVFTMADGEEVPMVGTPVFLRIAPRGSGDPVTAFGTERPSGSGHYVADIVVPPSGIGIIEIGLRGESCEAGVCSSSEMLFSLTGDTLVSEGGVVPIAPAPDPAATSAAVVAPPVVAPVATPASAPAATPVPWAVLILVGLAVIAMVVAVAFVVRARRLTTV